MTKEELFARALDSFAASYDIERDKRIAGRTVSAYAQLRALNSRYILDKKHVIWTANAFEHAVFVLAETLDAEMVEDWFSFLTRQAEAELIHPNAPVPPEGHMVSYLTVIFLADSVSEDAKRAVKRCKFTKNYRFSLRGWAAGRAVAVSCGEGYATGNAEAKEMTKHLEKLMKA